MSLRLSGLLFVLVVALPSGSGLFGNRGVQVRTCTKLHGLCFFGCKPGWTWVAFCHNILSCCTQNKVFLPPQSKEV
ncbi:beta-defensin 136 [Fukomys damarensis]|uniref:Beta-defensin 136 n=1 Tax=Fukomys damarensis TaxID=885580 RepID=A0A091E620_FUKDA|nr:beta-defensin 136 [Fukomys damarensis]KFO38050.1 Beta-defensin 136 [Fukomys damarensis]